MYGNNKINSECFHLRSQVNLIFSEFNNPRGTKFPLHFHVNTLPHFNHNKYKQTPFFAPFQTLRHLTNPFLGGGAMIFTVENALKLIHWQKQQQKIFLTRRSQSANANSNYLLVIISSPETLH